MTLRRALEVPLAVRTLLMLFLLLRFYAPAASFQEDANGFVFMEAENFDVNVTQNNGAWIFDNTPLNVDPFSGWGYMDAFSTGGTDPNTNPHLDFSVSFVNAGPHYIWVGGSDAGGKTLSLGLDGVAPTSAQDVGGPDGAFGARDDGTGGTGGQLKWVGTNNVGSGYNSKAYLTVAAAGTHTVNVFIREAGLKVDWILLTTNIDYEPGPYPNPSNIPAQTLAPSSSLTVAVTQPANGKSFANGTNSLVRVAAKPATNGTSVAKIEFFAKLLPSGANNKIGEATALPYLIGWSNPPAGNYALTARVTDSSAANATSAVVNIAIVVPSGYLTPLSWKTNNFDSGLGSFTLVSQNHASGFDFDWRNSNYAGGTPGELGGLVVRSFSAVPYVAEPLARSISLNEDLWFAGSLMLSNVNGNNDSFIGYFDANSSSHPRMGLKVREPTGFGSPFRFSVEPTGFKLTQTLPDTTSTTFEFHWIPTGFGDGSGTLTGMVAGASFSVDLSTLTNAVTFNAFGWLAPSQGNDDVTRSYYEYIDNLAYQVPGSQRLNIQRLPANRVLLSWAIDGYTLQYNTNSLSSNNWFDSTDTVVQQGNTSYVTNSVISVTRWYRLRHPL